MTLQVKTGWSMYKNWPLDRWDAVVRLLPHIQFVQIGQVDEGLVSGDNNVLDARGLPLEESISLVSNADLHVGLDSFANHLTHYLWWDPETKEERRVPGIVLWGSTQVSASGYPTNTNISLGLPCQPCFREDPKISQVPRGVCDNPPGQTYEDPKHACMTGITVEMVARTISEKFHACPNPPILPQSFSPEAP